MIRKARIRGIPMSNKSIAGLGDTPHITASMITASSRSSPMDLRSSLFIFHASIEILSIDVNYWNIASVLYLLPES